MNCPFALSLSKGQGVGREGFYFALPRHPTDRFRPEAVIDKPQQSAQSETAGVADRLALVPFWD